MGEACGTHGREGKYVRTGFGWGTVKVSEHLEHLVMNGKAIFKWILKNWIEGCRLDQSGSG
jgi:hypothetical protein